jgi:Fic family protein
MNRLCEFANRPIDESPSFVHPAIQSILLHFWLAYDHPFVDGNGRTARALFYWSMLKHGYWLTEYLAISSIIRQQPKQYARAFLDTELDENDLTYFVLYHLRVVELSLRSFQEYLERKWGEKRRFIQVAVPARFNERQQAILSKALKDPETRFTYTSHANSHGMVLATARADLLDLQKQGLLRKNTAGRRFEFVAALDLEKRLRKLSIKR